MGVETFILIAIVIFGAVSIFILMSINSAVARTANTMAHVVFDIEAIKKTVDAYPRPQTSGGKRSERYLSEINVSTSLISDRTFGMANEITHAVSSVQREISNFKDELRNELVIRFPPRPDFG